MKEKFELRSQSSSNVEDFEAEVEEPDTNFILAEETHSSEGSSYYENNEDIAQHAYNQDNDLEFNQFIKIQKYISQACYSYKQA